MVGHGSDCPFGGQTAADDPACARVGRCPTMLPPTSSPLREHRGGRATVGRLVIGRRFDVADDRANENASFSPLIAADGIAYRRLGRGLRGSLRTLRKGLPLDRMRQFVVPSSTMPFGPRAHEKLPTDLTTPLARLRAAWRRTFGDRATTAGVPGAVGCVGGNGLATTPGDHGEGSGAAARAANSDLDSVLALFQAAARADEVSGLLDRCKTSCATCRRSHLSRQQLRARGRERHETPWNLLTAHRAKGLQWRRVFILGVQEESWPDLRSRPSLLLPDRLHADGIGDPPLMNELLEDERRLFYVACTRARESLTVTAVANAGQSPSFGEQPSRFLAEVAADTSGVGLRHEPGYQLSALSMSSVVASLRATLESDETSAALKHAAAERLAHLASQELLQRIRRIGGESQSGPVGRER